MFAPKYRLEPYELRIKGRKNYLIRLPGNIEYAFVRSDLVGEHHYVISVRIATSSADADVVGGYLAQCDYYSAHTMTTWAKEAEHMLQMKMSDPYAATIAAYLLLRLERFDLMRNWPRNLADLFTDIPDGCIIWATQCALTNRDRSEVLKYVDQAMERGLPIYTEGLNWLLRILRQLGDDGRKYLDALGENMQGVVMSSPFLALEGTYKHKIRTTSASLDVAYATKL